MPVQPAPFADRALYQVRQQIRDSLGAEAIARLHKPRPALDKMVLLLAPLVFLLNAGLLSQVAFGFFWCLLFVLQGFLLQWMGLVSHDLLVHRRVLGERGSWWAALVLTLPRLTLPTGYELAHLAHHRHIGTERDTEAYKQHLDTRARRLQFSTLAGIKLAQAGRLEPESNLRAYHDVSGQGQSAEDRALSEKKILRGMLLGCLLLAIWWPGFVVLGYLLPLLIMAPIVNSLRIILEHADADPANPWGWSTFYRTNGLNRFLFFWDSGDCHLVHHIFPRLPWYHMTEAVRLMRPLILAQGVVERRSYWALLRGWYLDGFPHRSQWPLATREKGLVVESSGRTD